MRYRIISGIFKPLLPFIAVALIMGCFSSAQHSNTHYPNIDEIYANPSDINLGDSTVVICYAHDEDNYCNGEMGCAFWSNPQDGDDDENHELTYSWSCSQGTLTPLDSFNVMEMRYIPDDTGTFYIRVTVSDGKYETTDSTEVRVYQGVNFLNGEISGILQDTTYLVNGDVYVAAGEELIIEPGAVISFCPNSYFQQYDFYVDGEILAEGTIEDSIIFENRYPDHQWGRLLLNGAFDQSVLQYCRFSGSMNGVHIASCNPQVRNCVFSGNEYNGLYLSYSSSEVSECFISGNNGSGVEIGGWCTASVFYPKIEDCIIADNFGYGISIGGNAHSEITRCQIYGNGGGVNYFNKDNGIIRKCTIYGNTGYNSAGLRLEESYVEISNCIISGDNGMAGIYMEDQSTPVIMEHSCIFGNPRGNFSFSCYDLWGYLTNVNANGDSCDFFNNIILSPMMVNPNGGDFNLGAGSPCIDAGDPAVTDPDGTVSDIGAVYYQQ